MLTKVTFEEIDNYLREQYAIRPTVMELIEAEGDLTVIDGLYLKSEEPKEEHCLTVTLYASEANFGLLARCQNNGFFISATRDFIHIEEPFHLHYLGDLIDTASLVMRQYDNPVEEGEPDIWKEYGLRGDDAVDYNGSYLLTLADCINMYFTLKSIPDQTISIELTPWELDTIIEGLDALGQFANIVPDEKTIEEITQLEAKLNAYKKHEKE